ncbi:MAG: PrgI family protein [Candidatus Paceibacterota bacterium]
MRYQVPQFIEIEDKIIGPFTFKQFVYMGGGLGIAFIVYKLLPFYAALLIIAPVLGFSFALAFIKINNKPFIFVVESAIRYYLGSRLYLWKKEEKKTLKKEEAQAKSSLRIPKLSESKLKELTWSLDINENLSGVSKEIKEKNSIKF